MKRVLEDLRVTLDDVDAVVEDMLLPPRERRLGPALHAEKYREAWEKVVGVVEDLASVSADANAPIHGPGSAAKTKP